MPAPKPGFTRFVRREPLGVVLVIAPWNYPYLTAVNSVVPAILAGNAVILRHSAQTPLCAERFDEAFRAAGLPPASSRCCTAITTRALRLIGSDGIDFVAFTGLGGRRARGRARRGVALHRHRASSSAARTPPTCGPTPQLDDAVAQLVDGAFFNAGQSCCGIERIYVHADVYEPFVEAYAEGVRAYRLGDPLRPRHHARAPGARQRGAARARADRRGAGRRRDPR